MSLIMTSKTLVWVVLHPIQSKDMVHGLNMQGSYGVDDHFVWLYRGKTLTQLRYWKININCKFHFWK